MFRFEDFISDFSANALSHEQFLFNVLLTAVLSYLLGLFYIRYGNAIANRRLFARNFMLLALTTMLIIYIVKSSIALSLGLVGALSIVRFRAAIKEPEELTYLFLTIGVGLGMGANQTVITLMAFVLILTLLFIQALLNKKAGTSSPESMYLNISTNAQALGADAINTVLAEFFTMVELKRLDQHEGRMDLSYVIESGDVSKIIQAKDKLMELDSNLNFSFVEHRNLPV